MKRLIFLGIFGCFLFFSLAILASVPNLINYQGRLTDAAGSPITSATTVRFSIYQGGSAGTAGSGTLVYEEDASVTPDSNGVFDHTIGTGTVISGTLNASVFNTSLAVFLEITVDPAGLNETLLPRKRIVTVGYSFKAQRANNSDKLDGLDSSDFALVGHHHDADYVNEGQADSVTSSMIVNGTIVDADINASANISASKINTTGLDADLLDGKDSLDFVHTSGDDMTGTLNVNTSTQFALYGTSSRTPIGMQPATIAVHGMATGSSGTTYGVYGISNSSSGRGVYGTAPLYGVYGEAPYTGVRGYATATSGANYGVHGKSDSTSGYGVFGTAPTRGVYGRATAISSRGVYGRSDGTSGYGVYGLAIATSGTNYGVYGATSSSSGYGVYGIATTFSGTNYGVYGQSNSTSGRAVYGVASATSGVNYAVYGITYSSSGYAGLFNGRVLILGNAHVTGNLTVGGSKPCVQPIDNGKKVLLYAMESPEIWFEDFGTAQLVNGQAVVQLERLFAQTANTEAGYMVFLTPIGEWQGLYISRQDKDCFEVREQGGGTSNISFYYRIVAKRRGYEDVRFEEFTEPEKSPEEPNLLTETKAAKVKQPQRP